MSASLGISLGRSGLFCRADPVCRFVSPVLVPQQEREMSDAVAVRDGHESFVHHYIHVPSLATAWSFSQKFSRRGRSTIKD